jgi:hypothetical protein
MERRYNRMYAIAIATLVLSSATAGFAQERPRPVASNLQDSLKAFLRRYLSGPPSAEDKTTRFSAALVQLGSDGSSQVIVYVTGRSWCGSGGCLTLILAPLDVSYRVVTRITISRPPIRVLTSTSNGWHDIGVWVQGGGIQPGYEARLRFDGKSYPRNPSIRPAEPLTGKISAEMVLSPAQEGTPLYP